jgi:hypothetical protein
MSYGRSSKKEYEQPPPSTGLKGKLGIKPKGQFEKDIIDKSTEKLLKESKEEADSG